MYFRDASDYRFEETPGSGFSIRFFSLSPYPHNVNTGSFHSYFMFSPSFKIMSNPNSTIISTPRYNLRVFYYVRTILELWDMLIVLNIKTKRSKCICNVWA